MTDTAIQQLTKGQAARRQRVIAAALELGAEGGYDAVQMRDVASRADVALGTIYRYFSSKDHLLADSLVEWTSDMERQVSKRPPSGDTTADRLVQIMRRAVRAMEKEPRLSAAVLTALSSDDPHVVACQRDVAQVMGRIQSMAFPEDFDDALQARITRALGHVWFASLVAWVNGWFDFRQTEEDLDSAAHLMLDRFG